MSFTLCWQYRLSAQGVMLVVAMTPMSQASLAAAPVVGGSAQVATTVGSRVAAKPGQYNPSWQGVTPVLQVSPSAGRCTQTFPGPGQ